MSTIKQQCPRCRQWRLNEDFEFVSGPKSVEDGKRVCCHCMSNRKLFDGMKMGKQRVRWVRPAAR